MKINTAEFVLGAVNLRQLPKDGMPEVAFLCRSNVGKSSIINKLCNRKSLARPSSEPGKTREMNYYLINKEFYFVDLPGYGYARLPEQIRSSWGKLIEQYLKSREQLSLVLQLVDARHEPTELDMMMIGWLDYYEIPFLVALTKADKLPVSKMPRFVETAKENVQPLCELQRCATVLINYRPGKNRRRQGHRRASFKRITAETQRVRHSCLFLRASPTLWWMFSCHENDCLPRSNPVPEDVLLAWRSCSFTTATTNFTECFIANDNLRYVFQTTQPVRPRLNCSGTGGMEATFVNLFSPGETVIAVNGGKFGERWVQMPRTFGLQAIEITVEWGKAVDVDRIEDALRHPEAARWHHHSETSTSAAIDPGGFGQSGQDRSEALVCADGITSVGAHGIPVR